MSNYHWAVEQLIVKGDSQDVEKFMNDVNDYPLLYGTKTVYDGSKPVEDKLLLEGKKPPKKNVLCFDKVVPKPGKVRNAGFETVGLFWEKENWGCKWGACHTKLDDTTLKQGYITYNFHTDWCAPYN